MNEPISIARSITLITDEKLNKEEISNWYQTMRNLSPNGILMRCQTTDEKNELRDVILVHREIEKKQHYIIPISRPLMEDEVEKLVEATASILDIDFDLDVTQITTSKTEHPVEVNNQKYVDLCTTWARKQHENWMKERQDAGWTYGATVNFSNKTHPLLVQWDNLPDRYKNPDLDQPQMLMDLLNDQGYAIVRKEELDAIRKLMRNLT